LITIYVLILGTIVSLGFGPLSFIKLLGLGLLDFFDFISNSVLMPIVAILTCICVGHFIGPKVIEDEVELNGPFKIKKFYRIMLKWVAPIFLALILIFAISETMGLLYNAPWPTASESPKGLFWSCRVKCQEYLYILCEFVEYSFETLGSKRRRLSNKMYKYSRF